MPPELSLLSRRTVLAAAAAAPASLAHAAARPAGRFEQGCAQIEARTGGRLGIHASLKGGDKALAWRQDERFRMCSTFKVLAAATVLHKVDLRDDSLGRRIPYGKADLLDYAPVTTAHLAEGGLTLAQLCAAAVEYSDNTAANLILESIGGPAGVNDFIENVLDDEVTHLDRTEPALNFGAASDQRDTTTPASMAGLWRKVIWGKALSPISRDQLVNWLLQCRTGAERLPSILPPGWRIAHKTGTGQTAGDVAEVLPPNEAPPVILAVYLEAPKATPAQRDAAIADAGRLALRAFSLLP